MKQKTDFQCRAHCNGVPGQLPLLTHPLNWTLVMHGLQQWFPTGEEFLPAFVIT